MRHLVLLTTLAAGLMVLVVQAIGQGPQGPPAERAGAPPASTPEQRAASTRAFLGLGPAPDKAAAARGTPLYQRSCSFCHGADARGAEGPNLIVSDVVLGDDHGEHLVAFLKKGRPEKGMPSFSGAPDGELKDITEFLHQQVEDVANRGTYRFLDILVGDAAEGKAYVASNCTSCHASDAFAHIAAKFRTPDQLQRSWIWPPRPADNSLAVTATVRMADGSTISGRLTSISDFQIVLVDGHGQVQTLKRDPAVAVNVTDPLAPHETMIMTLKNGDMHNVTAYLESLK